MKTEAQYLQERDFNPEEYEVVTWPDSQDYLGYTEEDDVYLVIDDEGLELFGSSAYIIPKGLEPYDDFEDELANLSEDEVRDLTITLNDNAKDMAAKLDVAEKTLSEAKRLLSEAKESIGMARFELEEEWDEDDLEAEIGNFLNDTK